MSLPAPVSVKTPEECDALPARPTLPTSCVSQGDGNVVGGGGGGGGAAEPMVAVVLADAVAPALSRTVNVTVNVPLVEYVCDAEDNAEDVSAVPSPQRHV
jgi:hypothetical protein